MYLPCQDDVTERAAEWVLAHCADRLPDLTRLTILVPTAVLLRPLREALQAAASARGHAALLGPTLVPFVHWPARRLGAEAPIPLSREACELRIHEALRAAPRLARADSRWQLAESLLGLFDELGAARETAPDDFESFRQRLREAYGIPERLDAPLSREARMVHELWNAWQEQLAAEDCLDPAISRVEQWRRSIADLADDELLLILQPEWPGPAIAELLQALHAAGRAGILLRGNDGFASAAPLATLGKGLSLPQPPEPETDEAWIDAALEGSDEVAPLAQRAREFTGDSPVHGRWRRVAAPTAEDEARTVVLAAIEQLQERPGQRVVIATENRRLARRIRALLERFDVALADRGGWATSTTRAAAVLERWLECIEQDFDQRPLLDVLQSPFLREAGLLDDDRDRFDATVHHFERDIVRHENIARSLGAYDAALRSRTRRLSRWSDARRRDVRALLGILARAARPLQRMSDGRFHPVSEQVEALFASLATLGLDRTLADDEAGQRVLAVLERLRSAASGRRVKLDWRDFRTWTGRALEQEPFTPRADDSRVLLADLARAADLPAGCLILAGLDAEHVPGAPGGAPFFNDGVRAELGLVTWNDRWQRQLYRFRRALGTAPRIVFTHALERDGEPIAASPWLEALVAFHGLAFGTSLDDPALAARARAFDRAHRRPLPAATRRPAPATPAALLPERLSAGRHADLVACPYRFHAGTLLGLEPLEEVREELEKADYGERLHRALEAFWQPVAGMPAPWSGPIDADRRDEAETHLARQIDAAFALEPGQPFGHRAWHRRALSLVPALIDWAIRHVRDHEFERGEARETRPLAGGPTLHGRLDRVDRHHDGGLAVTDYKTGAVAGEDDIRSGEDVQLASYALLLDDVRSASYLRLDRARCRPTGLEGEDLERTAMAVERRLVRLWQALSGGAPLPAWSNRLCEYCRYEGLCRRPLWPPDDAPG